MINHKSYSKPELLMRKLRPWTLNDKPQPQTLFQTPNPKPQTLNLIPWILHPNPQILSPEVLILHLNFEPLTRNPKP